jgi:LL-diaminopimelate aminotransferase
MIVTANRMNQAEEYYFSQKLREIDALNRSGKKIINLGIGSPDLAPDPGVIRCLQEESAKPHVHGYQSYRGLPALRQAMASFYGQWYGVKMDADTEILPLMGSKEGIMHLSMTYLNEGDAVLVPNPGYPAYRSAALLAGAQCLHYDLLAVHDWQPDMEQLERLIHAHRVKMIWLNYPHMPTGSLPRQEVMQGLVDIAIQHNILLCHDNPYSFIRNEAPMSIFSIPNARETCVELNSLSKSVNMAGWRVGMLLGAEERIQEVLRFKSNMDSGMFLPVQMAAAAALELDAAWYADLNKTYYERERLVYDLLDFLGCTYEVKQAGLFVWAKVPPGFADGYALSDHLLYQHQVFITPGGIFGSNGDGYIRVSLCQPLSILQQALLQIQAR